MRDKHIRTILWAICGPIIVWPGYKDMPLPKNVRWQINCQRLLMIKKELASEAETLWYLSTASLAHPFNHDWCQIMVYLFRRFQIAQNKPLPAFVKQKVVLDEHCQKAPLRRLREWLFKSALQANKNQAPERPGNRHVRRQSCQ